MQHKNISVLAALVVAGVGAGGGACRSGKRAPLEDFDGLDLAAASTRVQAIVVDCRGVTRALQAIAASPALPARSVIGLVDETVELGRAKCRDVPMAIKGTFAPMRLARAKLADTPEASLAALAPLPASSPANPDEHAAIYFRRSELLESLGRSAEALVELTAGLRLEDSAIDRAREVPLQIATYAASGQVDKAIALVAKAAIDQRTPLANRLVAHAPAMRLAALGERGTVEIATAVGDRLEREHGPGAAIVARTRATTLVTDDADLFDALARSLAAVDRIDEAVAAWDRAAVLAPAQPAFRLAPIRALVATPDDAIAKLVVERHHLARKRVDKLVEDARAQPEQEPFITASHAAVLVGDAPRAVAILREARAKHPADGRLAFELGSRQLDAKDRSGAVETFVELLVCGAHGRPWHRHEIAGRLATAATDEPARQLVKAALDRPRTCKPAEPADLATYVAQLRSLK